MKKKIKKILEWASKYFRVESRSFLLETILGFIVVDAINYIFFPQDMGFIHVRFHPYWLIILPICVQHGFGAGLFASLVGFVHFIYFYFHRIPSRLDLERMSESGELYVAIAFLVLAGILGDISRRHLMDRQRKTEMLERNKVMMDELQGHLEKEQKARNTLESRIVGETMTVKTLYEAASRFESLKEQEIYDGYLDILNRYFKVTQASLFMIEGDFFILKASIGWTQGMKSQGKVSCHKTIMNLVMSEKKVLSIRDVLKHPMADRYQAEHGTFLAIIPILNESEVVVGAVKIEQMDFLVLNRPNLEMMELMLVWAMKSVKQVDVIKESKQQSIWSERYELMSYRQYRVLMEQEFDRVKQYSLSSSLAFIKIGRFGFLSDSLQEVVMKTVVALLKEQLNNTDSIFEYQFDGTLAILSPMKNKEELGKLLSQAQEKIEELVTSQNPQLGNISIRYGVAECDPSMKTVEDWNKPALSECQLG